MKVPRRRFLQLLGLGAASATAVARFAGAFAKPEPRVTWSWEHPTWIPSESVPSKPWTSQELIELQARANRTDPAPWLKAMVESAFGPRAMPPGHSVPAPFAVHLFEFNGMGPGQVPEVRIDGVPFAPGWRVVPAVKG